MFFSANSLPTTLDGLEDTSEIMVTEKERPWYAPPKIRKQEVTKTFPDASSPKHQVISPEDYDELAMLQILREKSIKTEDPVSYGMPDLLVAQNEGESDKEYRIRREQLIYNCVREKLYIVKDGRKVTIKLIDKMIELITDLFYQYHSKGIIWKPRGGGGSLTAAILIWLCMVYRKKSFLDMASSGTQAKVIYDYVCQFWRCVPALAQNLLQKEPLLSETRLTNGVILKCSTTSELQTRGKHMPGFVSDESCSDVANADKAILAGMQGAMSEPEHIILMLSTFHYPTGLYQEFWDNAEEKGFKRYKWDIFDVMEKCEEPIDCRVCPLTIKKDVKDMEGKKTGVRYIGCAGKARTSAGYLPYKNIITTFNLNKGTDVFEVEFACNRPGFHANVWDYELVDSSVAEEIKFDNSRMKAVGIDWGLTQTAVILVVELPDSVYIHTSKFLSGTLTEDIMRLLKQWQEMFGDNIEYYTDASHPYNNLELENAGFDVTAVEFSKWKDFAIQNVSRYLGHYRLKINKEEEQNTILVEQMRGYRRNKLGKIIKKDDHGPDALIMALMCFIYIDKYGSDSPDSHNTGMKGTIVF